MRLVIPSVDHADFLAAILPAWQALLPNASITVVTAPKDHDTQALTTRLGARLDVTDVWYAEGHTFDKAAALDHAFGITGRATKPPAKGERCLAIDSDVYPFGHLPEEKLQPRAIYGCARYLCATPAELEAHKAGRTKRRDLPLMLARYRGCDAPDAIVGADRATTKRAAHACLGYFQLFRYYPGQSFGSFKTAGKYDIVFREAFAKRVAIRDFYVLHLGTPSRQNWRGRTVGPWCGSHAANSLISLDLRSRA
jgi:hypothetical protein